MGTAQLQLPTTCWQDAWGGVTCAQQAAASRSCLPHTLQHGEIRLPCSDGAIPVMMPCPDLLRQAKQGQGSCEQRVNSVILVVMSLVLLQHCHLQRWQAMQELGTCSQQAAVWCHLSSPQASTCLCD